MQKPETKFRNKIVVPYLKRLKNCYFMSIQQSSIVGDPDIVACISGRFIGLELKKSEKDKPRPIQQWKLDKISESGGLSFSVCPENWTYVRDVLYETSLGEWYTTKELQGGKQWASV